MLWLQESGVAYSVRLNNGERVRVVVYVVSDDPKAVVVPGAPIEQRYQWNSVTRAHCKKGCSGPILRAIQRFGRQGRCAWMLNTRFAAQRRGAMRA